MSEELNFTYDEIRTFVLNKMIETDTYPKHQQDTALALDGRIHRYDIEGHKNGSRSGAYCIHPDGVPACYIQDWSKPDAKFSFNMKETGVEIKRATFDIKEWEEKKKQAEAELKRIQAEASDRAYEYYQNAVDGDFYHRYLEKKQVNAYNGVRLDNQAGKLIIPISDINGHIQTIQTINSEGEKRFFKDAPKTGNFFAIGLENISRNDTRPIFIGEGYATVAKFHEITGATVVAAIDCGNLEPVATALHSKYPKNPLIVIADNDIATEKKTGKNPGILAAQNLVNLKLAIGYIAPPFNQDKPEGSDWDDFAIIYGAEKTRHTLYEGKGGINWLLMPQHERKEYETHLDLIANLGLLNPSIKLPPQEFIGGIFPRGYISAVVAPPGTGKTIFMQKTVSDLSLGGTFFDGVTENEPVRKCLIFAAEAGYELLLRRGASFKWPINPKNVMVANQYTYESKGYSLMLDNKQGFSNVKDIIETVKPDIVFFDTFASFHEKDENKATDMKPIIAGLTTIARDNYIAIVLNHHSRKRSSKERTLALNQDDVIGSSIFNRLVGLIIGIEPRADEEKTLRVKVLKSWFSVFTPFDYSITEDDNGHSRIETNLAPEDSGNSRIAVWNYLRANFKASSPGNEGEWFSASQIVLSDIGDGISERLLRKIIFELIKNGKLKKRGSTKDTEYSVVGFYG